MPGQQRMKPDRECLPDYENEAAVRCIFLPTTADVSSASSNRHTRLPSSSGTSALLGLHLLPAGRRGPVITVPSRCEGPISSPENLFYGLRTAFSSHNLVQRRMSSDEWMAALTLLKMPTQQLSLRSGPESTRRLTNFTAWLEA